MSHLQVANGGEERSSRPHRPYGRLAERLYRREGVGASGTSWSRGKSRSGTATRQSGSIRSCWCTALVLTSPASARWSVTSTALGTPSTASAIPAWAPMSKRAPGISSGKRLGRSEETGSDRLHVVAHSLGGVVLRWAAATLACGNWLSVGVTLGSPHWARPPHTSLHCACPGSEGHRPTRPEL